MFSENLSASTQKQLEEIGVTVRTNGMVTLIEEHKVHLGDDVIEADTIIWAAGVAAGPLAKTIGVPVDRAGRITIQPDLTIEGHPEIYVIGDVSALPSGPEGRPLPGIAPVAQQEGTHAGENIARAVNGEPLTEFTYKDPGSMAVIGRNRAIASIRGRELSGPAAWVLWEGAHVTKLHGSATSSRSAGGGAPRISPSIEIAASLTSRSTHRRKAEAGGHERLMCPGLKRKMQTRSGVHARPRCFFLQSTCEIICPR